jgi:hypothetical protein
MLMRPALGRLHARRHDAGAQFGAKQRGTVAIGNALQKEFPIPFV